MVTAGIAVMQHEEIKNSSSLGKLKEPDGALVQAMKSRKNQRR